MRATLLIAIIGAAAAGCGVHHSDGQDGGTVYDSLDVEPAQVTLDVALGGAATQAYQVFGTVDGQTTDISSTCASNIDPSFGSADVTTIKVGPHGGTTTLTAVCGTQTGTSSLTVNLSGTIVVGVNTPANSAALFGAATAGNDATRLPVIQYPLDQAIAPLNIPPIEVQWATGSNDLFHISLTSTNAAIDIYATDPQVALDAIDWGAVAGTAAGATLAIVVEGLAQATPTAKFASAAVTITMSHDTIDTSALYYWASSQGSIMTETFGQTTPPTVVKSNCTACHSLSRAGTRLGYSRCVNGSCDTEWTGFMHYDPVSGWNEVVDADNKQINGTYTTFSPLGNPFPDDSQSVALVTMNGGALGLYDPDTGSAVASNVGTVSTMGGSAARSALMPDWSPDGSTIVFASVPERVQVDLNNSIDRDDELRVQQRHAHVRHAEHHHSRAAHAAERLVHESVLPELLARPTADRVRRGARELARLLGGVGGRSALDARDRGWHAASRSVGGERRQRRSRHHVATLGARQHDGLLLGRVLERARLRPRGHGHEHGGRVRRERRAAVQADLDRRRSRRRRSRPGSPWTRARRRCGCRARIRRRTTSARTGPSRPRSSKSRDVTALEKRSRALSIRRISLVVVV